MVSGNSADDPLYVPAIKQIREVLNRSGVLYVGDSKMGALETRREIQAGGDYYLVPLSATIVPEETLDNYLAPLWEEGSTIELTHIYKEDVLAEQVADEHSDHQAGQKIAEGFEVEETLRVEVNGQIEEWTERRLVVRSVRHAQAQETKLDERLDKAEQAIHRIPERRSGKTPITDATEAEAAINTIVQQYDVEGLIDVEVTEHVVERQVRAYGGKPARIESQTYITVVVTRNPEAIEQVKRRLGWRVYAVNAPVERFSLATLIKIYRNQYIIEKGNARLKGKPLSLKPIYLQREDHMVGLVRLLSIALCGLTLLEFVVRRALQAEGEALPGIYPGNPRRSSFRPSAELLLKNFKGVSGVFQPAGQRLLLTPLTAAQRRILRLLGFSEQIYGRVGAISVTG